MQRPMRATVTLSSGERCLLFEMCVCECLRVRPSGAGCPCLQSPVLGVLRSGLHLTEEVSAAVLLQAAGEDLAAGLRHQQGVFELSRALPVSGHRRPAVGPRLVLPATWDTTPQWIRLTRHQLNRGVETNTQSLEKSHWIPVWYKLLNDLVWGVTAYLLHHTSFSSQWTHQQPKNQHLLFSSLSFENHRSPHLVGVGEILLLHELNKQISKPIRSSKEFTVTKLKVRLFFFAHEKLTSWDTWVSKDGDDSLWYSFILFYTWVFDCLLSIFVRCECYNFNVDYVNKLHFHGFKQ